MELNEKDYAPVFIPTLCRYEHFKRCVDSLSKCTGANNTTLIIGLDFPLKNEHWDGYNKIKKYIEELSGFKDVIVIERSENYGALKNVVEAQKYIFERYEKCIYSEDDNEFSPNFLEFVNKGLVKYKNDPRVLAICGYVYPKGWSYDGDNCFLGLGFSAWGVGEWRDKRISLKEQDVSNYLDNILHSWKTSLRIFMFDAKLLNSLLTMKMNKVVWGDVLITSNMLLNNKGCVFPTVSKVRNWGNDGTGLHCKKDDGTLNQSIDDHLHFDEEFDTDLTHNVLFKGIETISFPIKLLILLRYTIYRMTNIDILKKHYQNRKE